MDIKKLTAIKYVLMDALHEFQNARIPTEEYVAKRYVDHPDDFCTRKLVEVPERHEIAGELLQKIDIILDVLNIPEGEYWVVYKKVGDKEFAYFITGPFERIAHSIYEIYIPVTIDEYAAPIDVDGELPNKEAVKMLGEHALRIAHEEGRLRYIITEWKSVPVVEVVNG